LLFKGANFVARIWSSRVFDELEVYLGEVLVEEAWVVNAFLEKGEF
jgi:hypothetical protein